MKTIMYCPLNDGHIISMIKDFAQKKFEEIENGFQNTYGTVDLNGTNAFQKLICTLPTIDIQNSKILLFDKVVADYENSHLLDDFWEKNKMELQKPNVQKSTDYDLYFVVAALMQLKAHWKKVHCAQKREYSISAENSYSKEKLDIKGYLLEDVKIAINNNYDELSAIIPLGHNLDIRLSDITAFGGKNLEISNEKYLYELITSTEMRYYHSGSLIAPCIEETLMSSNHLQGINWKSKDSLYSVNIESSEALTKLKLNEKGVEARAETLALGRMVFTCSASNMRRTYCLVIKHGLVVDIRYNNESIFIAYIPQKRFITK